MLVATRNPLNIGAAARAMSNFGFRHLRLVKPYEAAFREARSAVGATELLAGAQEFDSVADAVADCVLVVGTTAGQRRHPQLPLHDLPAAAPLIRRQLRAGRVALLFGSEKRGLANQDFDHCHWLMRIPARVQHASMNLGQAVAICLYELARAAELPRETGTGERATAAQAERITALLTEALRTSGYLKARTAQSGEDKIRRLVRRLDLQAGDAELLAGMLRQILWKLQSR